MKCAFPASGGGVRINLRTSCHITTESACIFTRVLQTMRAWRRNKLRSFLIILQRGMKVERQEERVFGKTLPLRIPKIQKFVQNGTSLAVQWLGLCASTAGGTGQIPGRGTGIPCAAWHSHRKQKKRKKINQTHLICLFKGLYLDSLKTKWEVLPFILVLIFLCLCYLN